jgi:hypothetical protein
VDPQRRHHHVLPEQQQRGDWDDGAGCQDSEHCREALGQHGSPFIGTCRTEVEDGFPPVCGIVREMATMADLDRLALELPGTAREPHGDGRPAYLVHGKLFCCHRTRRKDAVDPATGELLDDVLMFRVPDLDVKELLLGDERALFFTTPHFDGYPAVLLRIPELARLDEEELQDIVVEAWLTRAQKRVAKAWLAEHAPGSG